MWQPILEGELAEQAREAVIAVARSLESDGGDPCKAVDRTLFWAYVAGEFHDDWVSAAYDDAITMLGKSAVRGFTNLSLYDGAAATGFAIAHVSEPGMAEDSLVAIDNLIANELAVERWTGAYDLVNGLVGFGVYLLERSSSTARRALDRVIAHLVARAERFFDGVAWHTSLDLMPPPHREECPDGYFNCGLAHGVPGVVALLGRVATRHDAGPASRALAADAMRWLATVRIPPDGSYPAWVSRGETTTLEPTRTAWCYGDPGVAIATWSACARLGLPTQDAIALARHCATRPFEATGVVDAGLCHGAAGLGHVFNRCFQTSQDPAFRDAARAWFRRALDMRSEDGRFLSWSVGPTGSLEWRTSTSFLDGPIGIALALLAGIATTEPSWDRILLCDLPQ